MADFMLVRYQGAIYVGRPRLVVRSWPDGESTLAERVEVYDPCWVYKGNQETSIRSFNDMMDGTYPYNREWSRCDGLKISTPDISVPLVEDTRAFAAWDKARRCAVEAVFPRKGGFPACGHLLPCPRHG